MRHDPLFRAFSQHALEPFEGPAPFHAEIESFAAQLDGPRLEEFFEARCAWHWYPVITDGFASGSLYCDIVDALSQEQLPAAIGYAAVICAREDGQRFVSALGLLTELTKVVEQPVPVAELAEHWRAIRDAAERNAIDSNVEYWFNLVSWFQKEGGVEPVGFDGRWIIDRPRPTRRPQTD